MLYYLIADQTITMIHTYGSFNFSPVPTLSAIEEQKCGHQYLFRNFLLSKNESLLKNSK